MKIIIEVKNPNDYALQCDILRDLAKCILANTLKTLNKEKVQMQGDSGNYTITVEND